MFVGGMPGCSVVFMGLILALRSVTLRSNVHPTINDDSANSSVRHGTCFHRRFSAHHAGAAPHSAVAELGAVRRIPPSHLKATLLITSVVSLTACLGLLSCSKRESATHYDARPATPEPAPEPSLTTPQPSPPAIATPDPVAGRRAQLVARIHALSDSECDALVLQLQLIPRDEVLEPISKPRKELLRYVRRIASAEDLNTVERAINERRPSQTL